MLAYLSLMIESDDWEKDGRQNSPPCQNLSYLKSWLFLILRIETASLNSNTWKIVAADHTYSVKFSNYRLPYITLIFLSPEHPHVCWLSMFVPYCRKKTEARDHRRGLLFAPRKPGWRRSPLWSSGQPTRGGSPEGRLRWSRSRQR